MKQLPILLLLFLVSFTNVAQDKKATKYAKTITTKDLESYLSVLAADSLEGRETGERGQKVAAGYIADKFREFGLEAPVETEEGLSYFQQFPLKKLSYVTTYLKKGDEKRTNFEDFLYYSRSETLGEEYIELVFAGTKTISALKEMDLKGKYIVVVNEEMAGWRTVMAEVKGLEAAGTFLIVEDESRYNFVLKRFSKSLGGPRLSLEADNAANRVVIGNPALAEWIFGKPYEELKETGEGTIAKIVMNADLLVEDVYSENVLGFLKGSEKPEEVLVVTAHYDHIGVSEDGSINNGADDDGSGTSTVLEMAEAFATAARQGNGPKRSILFMTVSGEEKGLLGSEYYSENPIFPMKNTVTNLNVDMVGRVDPAHETNPNYVYVIGADRLSQELHDLSEEVNQTYTKLELDYTYNDPADPNRFYERSDHYNFAKKGVPIIFYFNGTHADYHKPTDTIEKINFGLMRKRAVLIYHTAWELANRESRVVLNEETK